MAKITELATPNENYSLRKDEDGDFVLTNNNTGDEFILIGLAGANALVELIEDGIDRL